MITLGLKQQAGKRAKRPQSKLNLFLRLCRDVAEFMAENEGAKFKAFISQEGGGSLCLYLMTDVEAFDFALSGKLSEFAAPYIERGLLANVMLVPASTPEELGALFDVKSALRVEIEHA